MHSGLGLPRPGAHLSRLGTSADVSGTLPAGEGERMARQAAGLCVTLPPTPLTLLHPLPLFSAFGGQGVIGEWSLQIH